LWLSNLTTAYNNVTNCVVLEWIITASGRRSGLSISTGDSTAAELRLALTISLTLTDTGFAVLALLLGYRRRSPDPNASIQIESPVLIECPDLTLSISSRLTVRSPI